MYTTPNPICPQFIYECFFRIFSRKNHCLANDNKPKAVEVVFKYMKLFDNIDFEDSPFLCKHFDCTFSIDFVNYWEQDISEATLRMIAESYNKTPPNFQSLDDEQILRALHQIEGEIREKEEERVREMEQFNLEIQSIKREKPTLGSLIVMPGKKDRSLTSEEGALFH
jgi:hypothetical protein